MWKPTKPFNTPMYFYPVTGTENVLGVAQKTYADKGTLFIGSFATYGGTETQRNGVLVVEDTAVVETWYRPEFNAAGRVALADHPEMLYEIVGQPENIEMRNRYSKFKLRRVAGGA